MTTLVMATKVQSVPFVSKLTPEFLSAQAGHYTQREWVFSWSKDERCFHMRCYQPATDEESQLDIYVKAIGGYTFITDSDAGVGRLVLSHAMTMDEAGNATFVNAEAESQTREDVVRQMCFNRKEGNWRIWEKTAPSVKELVQSYRGATYLFWPRDDSGGHVFATAPMEIVNGVAVFGGS